MGATADRRDGGEASTSSSSAAAAAPLRPSKWVRPSYILSQTWRDRDPDLHVVSITASKELAWFFASSQRRPSRASWLVPRAECFVLIRSGRGCVGVVPLLAADLKAEAEQESLPTSSKSKSTVDPALASSGRVLWLHDRHGLQRGPKTTSIVAVSGPQPDACVAVASDNRRRIALYDRSGLTDAKPNATADSPLGSAKAFRWHDVAVSPAGDAVAAVCSCEGQEQALWLWARSAGDDQRGEGRWQRVGGASSPAMRVGAGGGLVAVEARVEEGGTAALVRTEVGPSQRPAVQEAKLEGFGGAARALAALSDGGDRAAVGIAGVAVPEAGVAVYVLDRRLEVVTEITSVGGDSNPGPIVALCFVPGGQGRVATLCEGGRALVHDAETGELAARCDDLGATFGFATLHPAVWGETVGLACGGGDGSVAVLSARGERAREGDGESESEGGLGATEEEEEEEMVVVGGEAGDPTWSGLVGSLMAEGDGEGDLPYLAEDLRGLLAKLPPGRGALSSLRRVAGSLCREGLHLRAAWVLEVAEASGELGGALANVDWLGLWERVANSAFERAEAEGAEPSRYQPLADALWKRLRASGLAPLVKPQIEAARSRSGRGHGTEASAALVEADRSFVLGDLDGSLALYASCGPAASLSTIACCVHARRLDEALQAAHDLLLAAEEDKSLVAEVREACSELGTLLLDLQPDKGVGCSDPADRSDLKIKIFFPSPVSWRAGDQNRRLALDRHELLRGHDHNGRMGGEPSVALALGLQCHALEPSALARGLEDAADVWDRAGHWKRACSLLESGARVMRQQGRPGDAASCEDGMASLVERRAAAMVGEGATTNPQLAPDLIQALAALRRRPEAYSRALRVALGAARAQIAGWCEIGDLGRLKALERGSKMAQEALGATLAALVAAAEPGLEVAGATLEEDWSVRVEVRGGGPSQEAARTALEEWVALASAARPYALLSLQWKQWQSSADASERRDCMREYALLLGLSLASDPEGLLRRPRDAQREACWVLRDLVSPEVVAEDPALVSLLAMCAGEDRLTGPTRRALLEMMASTGAEGDQEDYEEEAGYYLDVLRSDAETHVEELADICRSALRAADGGGGHKAGQVDEAIRSIWSMAEEILRGVPGRSSSGGWPDLSECVSHPLNCGEGVAIQTDEAVLASILNLGDLHVEDSGSAEEVPEELSAEELAMEEESAGEEEEGTRYVCAAFDYGSSAGLECEPGPGPVVLRIVVGAGEEEALEPTAEDPIPEAADLPGSEGGAEVLDKAAEKLVEEALAWAVEEAESRALAAAEDAAKDLVEKAIANAISEAVKLTERAATVESVEAVEEETPLEVEPEPDQEVSLTPAAAPGTEQAEPLECADEEPRLEESPCEALIEDAARTLVENAIAAAVSATVLEHAAVAEQEPDQPKAESLEEAAVKPDPLSPEEVSGDALVVRSLVEDAISHAISASQPSEAHEPESPGAEERPAILLEESSEDRQVVKSLVQDAITAAVSVVQQEGAEEDGSDLAEAKPLGSPAQDPLCGDTIAESVVKAAIEEAVLSQAAEQVKPHEEESDRAEAEALEPEEAESRALAAAEDAAKDLVEKAIANAISEAVKLTERAATVESVEAVEEETPLEVEPEPDQEVSLTPAAAPGTEQAEPLECADEEPRLEESPCEALIEDAARTLVENAIAAAVSATVLEHAAVAEQEPDQPKAESLEEAAVKPDPLSPEEVSGDALVVRSLVEDAISHAISATILQDVAEASIGMAGPAAPQAAPSPAGSEKTPAEPSDSPPSACEATPERESEPDASSSTKPLGDDTSDAGPESSQAVDSSLDGGDEVHSISDGSRRGGTFEDPGEIEAEEKAEERPWDTDLALFQSLGAGGGPPAPAPQPSKAQRPSRKEQRRRRQRQKTKPAAPASSDRRTSAESRAATTQTDPPATLGADIVVVEVARADPAVTEDLAPPTADLPAEGSPEGKSSHKDRVLSELRRIKEEYLAAIQDAQAALSGEDPSIGKVLGSQVETLQDYGEVLELAAASGEAEYGEVMVTASEGRQEEGEAPGDPEPEPAAEPASEPKVAEAEAEGDGARRRRRAAEMLKRIVRTSRDRRRSKGQERGPAFADAASSPIPPPSPPPPPAADLRSEVPLMRQADNLLEQMEEAVDLSSRTTLHQSDSEEPREENAALAAEEGDPPDLAKAALAALAAARFGLSGGSDPAFDLFSHFFELKSADPTSRLREKFRASPHTSAGLVRSSGLRGLLDQLSQFCGAGYSEQGVWYTELLFTLVLGGGRGSGWAAPEDSFVQVSWHYYQAHRPTGREERESEAVGALRSAVLALGGEVDLVAALEASEGSGIHTLPALPRLLGTLLRLAGHEPQVRDLCLLFGHLMRSPLGARADFEARDLMEVVRTGKVERWEEKRKEEAGQREPVAVVVSQMETSDSDSEDAVEAVEETVQQQQIKPPEAAQMMETSDSDSEDAVEVVEAVEETVQPAEEATPAPVRAPSTPAPAPAPAPKRDAATSPVSLPQPSPPPEPASPEASAEIDEEESEDIGGLGWLREGEAALKEILLDAKGGAEESWRRAPASPLERGSPRAVVDFFDVRTITAEDFHRESPDRSSVGLGLGGASTPRSRDSAPHPVPLPASNAELLAIFAEMEEEEPPPPRKKPASRVGGKVARKLERETTRALSRLKKAQASRRDRARDEVRDHSRREEQAMRRAREEVSKYARARQRNYNSMLRDVEEALVDAQVAAHTLEEENAQLRVCLDELSGEHRQEHDAYLGRLRDHLALVEAQVGAPLE